MSSRPTSHRPRGLARREALLVAAIEIVAERGTGAATHRAIAERAGVPASTTTYFFSSIRELVLEAMRHFTAARVEELAAASAVFAERDSDPRIVADFFAQALCATPTEQQIAQFEAYLGSARARNDEDRSAVKEMVGAFDKLAETALGSVGTPGGGELAPLFLALVDGFALRRIATGTPSDPALLSDAFYRLFVSYRDRPYEPEPEAAVTT